LQFLVYFFILDYRKINITTCFIKLKTCVDTHGEEEGIRSNQYLVVHGDNGVLLDPGGFGVMPSVLTELLRYIKTEQIKAIILSHQDPDIVGGLSTWLELTDALVYVSSIWLRFLPHYGIASMAQFVGVPDAGKQCRFAEDFVLQLVPAHFLHSEGQINVYDPLAKVLFTGDIGAAMLPVDVEYEFVDDFAAHLPYHRRISPPLYGFQQSRASLGRCRIGFGYRDVGFSAWAGLSRAGRNRFFELV